MFAISIIIKTSWLVLPFQNAESDGDEMYDTKMPSHQQERHTNVLKTYDVAPRNHFIFSRHWLQCFSASMPYQTSMRNFNWNSSMLLIRTFLFHQKWESNNINTSIIRNSIKITRCMWICILRSSKRTKAIIGLKF